MGNIHFDMGALLDASVNAAFNKHEEIKPLMKVLKKYGIQGFQALNFLRDLTVALHETNGVDAENG